MQVRTLPSPKSRAVPVDDSPLRGLKGPRSRDACGLGAFIRHHMDPKVSGSVAGAGPASNEGTPSQLEAGRQVGLSDRQIKTAVRVANAATADPVGVNQRIDSDSSPTGVGDGPVSQAQAGKLPFFVAASLFGMPIQSGRFARRIP